MPHARLTIEVRQAEVAKPDRLIHGPLLVDGRWLRHTASGVDEVELMLAANTGSEPRPLNKGASGGELSRVMLALEVALAGTSPVPTFVFDEVDAGVGGAAAVEVGRRLAQLARTAQVLVVTHLPQVAAYADRHVVVEKASDGSVTSSGPHRPRRRPAGAGAVPDARRDGRLRHRPGARPRAARGRPGGPPRLTAAARGSAPTRPGPRWSGDRPISVWHDGWVMRSSVQKRPVDALPGTVGTARVEPSYPRRCCPGCARATSR